MSSNLTKVESDLLLMGASLVKVTWVSCDFGYGTSGSYKEQQKKHEHFFMFEVISCFI